MSAALEHSAHRGDRPLPPQQAVGRTERGDRCCVCPPALSRSLCGARVASLERKQHSSPRCVRPSAAPALSCAWMDPVMAATMSDTFHTAAPALQTQQQMTGSQQAQQAQRPSDAQQQPTAAPSPTRWTVESLSRIPLHLSWPTPAMHDDSNSDDERKHTPNDHSPAAAAAAATEQTEAIKSENGTPKEIPNDAAGDGATPTAATSTPASVPATPSTAASTPGQHATSNAAETTPSASGEGTSMQATSNNSALTPAFSDRQLVAQGQSPADASSARSGISQESTQKHCAISFRAKGAHRENLLRAVYTRSIVLVCVLRFRRGCFASISVIFAHFSPSLAALRFYAALAPFLDDFLHPNSALAWLARARAARTGKIPVPPDHRWPKSVHGAGGRDTLRPRSLLEPR